MWLVTAPEGYNINLTFTDFEFSDVDSRQGCLDYLEIREGDGPMSKFIGRYCGQSHPGPVWAGNTLRVSMHSEANAQRMIGRFRAHYVAVGKFRIVHHFDSVLAIKPRTHALSLFLKANPRTTSSSGRVHERKWGQVGDFTIGNSQSKADSPVL